MGQISKSLPLFFTSGLILSSLFFLSPQTQNERDLLEESNRLLLDLIQNPYAMLKYIQGQCQVDI